MGGTWVSHPQHIRPRLESVPDGGGDPEVVLLRILGLWVTIEIVKQFYLPNGIPEELIAQFAVKGQPNAAQITQAGKSGKNDAHADFREVVGKELCVQAGHSFTLLTLGSSGRFSQLNMLPPTSQSLDRLVLIKVEVGSEEPGQF